MSKTKYQYVRINVRAANGRQTTVSISPADYDALAQLACGSVVTTVEKRVAQACREAARELLAEGFRGQFSAAVRGRAAQNLRAAYSEERAAAFEAAQFPEGVAVAA